MSDTTICLPVLPHYTLVISKTQVAGGLAARVGSLIRGRKLAFANKPGKKFGTGHHPLGRHNPIENGVEAHALPLVWTR